MADTEYTTFLDGIASFFNYAKDLHNSQVEANFKSKLADILPTEVANATPSQLSDISNTAKQISNNVVANTSGMDDYDPAKKISLMQQTQVLAAKKLAQARDDILQNPQKYLNAMFQRQTNYLANQYATKKINFQSGLDALNSSAAAAAKRFNIDPTALQQIKENGVLTYTKHAMYSSGDPTELQSIQSTAAQNLSDSGQIKLRQFSKDAYASIDPHAITSQLETIAANHVPTAQALRNSPLTQSAYNAFQQIQPFKPESLDIIQQKLAENIKAKYGIDDPTKLTTLAQQAPTLKEKQAIMSDALQYSTVAQRKIWLSSALNKDTAQTALDSGWIPSKSYNLASKGGIEDFYHDVDNFYTDMTKSGIKPSTVLTRDQLNTYVGYLSSISPSNRIDVYTKMTGVLSNNAETALINQMSKNNPRYGAEMLLQRLSGNNNLVIPDAIANYNTKGSIKAHDMQIADSIKTAFADNPALQTTLSKLYIASSSIAEQDNSALSDQAARIKEAIIKQIDTDHSVFVPDLFLGGASIKNDFKNTIRTMPPEQLLSCNTTGKIGKYAWNGLVSNRPPVTASNMKDLVFKNTPGGTLEIYNSQTGQPLLDTETLKPVEIDVQKLRAAAHTNPDRYRSKTIFQHIMGVF